MSDTADRLYERVLVLRCQTGDEAAFAELVERYQPRLRYYLRKMLGEGHRAEDALQDVWFAVFRAVPRLADVGAFRAWLYRIARDRAAREFRQRRPPAQPLREGDLIDSGADEASFTAEDVERVHAALDELPAERREVIVLRYIEAMSYEEIARVVGCELGTVRSRLHYAKRALRQALERMNVHD
ncbi:MAG: sigma-70 family RNA polymerase sigma factor [Gemmataceae bacterium]|nr:sigma-70 family RNA polymerase sigma factor [Gemmataceae bacterium]